ncbi:hypothetical protein PINS_up020391 [Pythium insidiosum]|nr:hypothetical protein PINS_up020391 [Pythium insidiosum]
MRSLLERLRRCIPLLEWLPRYDVARDLKSDFVAGATVAAMLVPQEMSLAALMGVPPQYGLYSAATAPLLYPFFGSSPVLSVANSAEGSLLVGVLLRDPAIAETMDEKIMIGVMLTFWTGAMLLVGGIFQEGGLLSFFSKTAMHGFVTASACLIVISQLPGWLGVSLTASSTPLSVFTTIEIMAAAKHTNLYSFALGIVSMIVLSVARSLKAKLQQIRRSIAGAVQPQGPDHDDYKSKEFIDGDVYSTDDAVDSSLLRTPGRESVEKGARSTSFTNTRQVAPLSQTVASSSPASKQGKLHSFFAQRPTLLATSLLLCDTAGVVVCAIGIAVGSTLGESRLKLTGAVPSGLPTLIFPPRLLSNPFVWERMEVILVNSFVIAMVFFMASSATALKLAKDGGYKISPNQELLGLGFANVGGAFFQAMPCCAGITLATPLASIITAMLVVLTLLFFTAPLFYLPRAPLSAIVIVATIPLIDLSEPKWIWIVRKSDFYVWLASYTGTMALGLVRGMVVSALASLVAIMVQSRSPRVVALWHRRDGSFVDGSERARELQDISADADVGRRPQDVVVIHIDHALYFGNVQICLDAIEGEMEAAKVCGRVLGLVLDGSRINDIDAASVRAIMEYHEKLRQREQRLTFANLRRDDAETLLRSGLWALTPSDERSVEELMDDISTAVAFLRKA